MAKVAKILNEDITVEFFKQIEKEHPYRSVTTEYKRELDYIAYPTDFFTQHEVRSALKKCGAEIIVYYMFIRERMGSQQEAYFIDITADKGLQFIEDVKYYLGFNDEQIKRFTKVLTQEGLIKELYIDERRILTAAHQIWNFLTCDNKRIASRESSARYLAKQKAEQENNSS